MPKKGYKQNKSHILNRSKKISGKNNGSWKGGVYSDKKKYDNEWRKKHPEILRKWRLKNKERKAGRKKSKICEICWESGVICFDHDHKTGKFRGWICQRCNRVLGFVKDNKELLNRLIDYL